MQVLEHEIEFLKQLGSAGVMFKSMMEPPLSKKRKRDENVPKENDESDSKRSKTGDSEEVSPEMIKQQQEASLDPVSEALDACDFGESTAIPSTSKVPKSTLVPIVRPDATLNFNTFIVKAPPPAPVAAGPPTPSEDPKSKTKKTVTMRDKKSRGAKNTSEDRPQEKKKDKAGDQEDAEVEKVMQEAFSRSCSRGPRKEPCFYEQKGLEYSSCEEESDGEEEEVRQKAPVSVMDDMYDMDTELVKQRVPVVKMVKAKTGRRVFRHADYVKMDAECLLCERIEVNKIFDQRLAAAEMALADTELSVSKCAKKAHLLYKEGYKSLTPDEIKQYNIPMMTSRHMARHLDIHLNGPDATNRRIADRHESTIRELEKYKIVQTDAGPAPNIKLVEAVVKLGKEIVNIRTKLHSRRATQVGKGK